MFLYPSGETIQKGDRIRYADGDGVVAFSPIATSLILRLNGSSKNLAEAA